jgi:hypothetical protein
MAGKRAKKPQKPGRKLDPESLRQSGRLLQMRIPAELADRARRAAGPGGLSEVVRRLLEEWLAGR